MKTLTFLFLTLFVCDSFCQTWKIYNTNNSGIPSNNVTGIATAEDGRIWISTVYGIACFDTIWHKYGINNSQYSDEIKHIWCVDSLVWVGTEYDGLWSFDGKNRWLDYDPNSAGNGIEGFGIDQNDTIWRLDKFGWFSKWSDNQWKDVITFIDHPNSLYVDKAGVKWILSGNYGLIRYSNGDVQNFKNTWDETLPDYIPDASLFCMVEDSHGNYWIGSDNAGLLKYDGSEFTSYNTTNSQICSNRIRCLAIDENNVLWIGSWDNGLSKYDGTNWTNYNLINSPLSSNIINSLAIGKDGKIWIANSYNAFISPPGGKGIIVLDENSDNSGGVAPNGPANLSLQGISVNEIVLRWLDNSGNEDGFIIERSINNQDNFHPIKYVVENTITFTDFNVSAENTYYYRIAAVNLIDTSDFSNIEHIVPKYCKINKADYSCYANVTALNFGNIHQTVFNSLNGYYNYLDLKTELKPGETLMMTVTFDRYSITSDVFIAGEIYIDWNMDGDFDDMNELIFQDLNIQGKKTYHFPVHVPENAVEGITRLRTRADDDGYTTIGPCGYAEETQDYTIIIAGNIPLAKPTDISAFGLNSKSIYLSWIDNSSSETGYSILRSSDSINFDKFFIVGSNTIEFIDTALNADTKYYYRIAAISNSDTSEFSDRISAITLSIDFEKDSSGNITSTNGFSVGAFWGDYNNDNRPDIYISGENYLYVNENYTLNNSELYFKNSGSAAWGDYNNDGYLDLFITSYNYAGGTPINVLYKNNGDNSFSEITPFNADGRVNNCVWLDFNNDGKLDIFLSYLDLNYGKFYLNNGNDTFSESFQINGASGFTTVADYDNDGDPDLFVVRNYNNNLLFDNNGDGTFTKNTRTIISLFSENSNGASWGDIDNDGDLDLFVANGRYGEENNALYINNGNGYFDKVFIGDIANDGGESYGSTFCDFDNDGNLDIIVSNFQQKNLYYRGNGDGTFFKVEKNAIMNEFSDMFIDEIPSMGCACGDYNQDGFQDILIVTTNGAENLLYKNSGNANNWIKLKLTGVKSNKSAIGAKVKIIVGETIQYREITTQTGFAGQNELSINFGLGKKNIIDTVIVFWPSGIIQVLTNIETNQFLEIAEPISSDIKDNTSDLDIMVFPNPFITDITITNNVLNTMIDIELIDINGRLIMGLNSTKSHTVLNTNNLSKGVYLLRVRNQKSILIHKIIKE